MKTTTFSRRVLVAIVLTNFTFTIFGGVVVLRKDDPSPTMGGAITSTYNMKTLSSTSLSTSALSDSPIYAYTDENTLTLSFDVLVRKMIIAVYDSNNMLMYQRQISTYTQTSLDIDMSSWESDDYTIRISYSNTNFVGEFTLE